MIDLPTVSFVLPTFNSAKTIDRCLKSIFSQKYPHECIEVIIIDGGSSDSTLEIVKSFPVKIIFNPAVHQDTFLGGRNRGLSASRGGFLAFINADQEISSSDWLQLMLKPLLEDPRVVMSISPLKIKKTSLTLNRYNSYLEEPVLNVLRRLAGDVDMYSVPENMFLRKEGYEVFRVDQHFPVKVFVGTGIVIRKNELLESGGYDYDYDSAIRLIKRGFRTFAYVTSAGFYHEHYSKNDLSAYVRRKVRAVRAYLKFRSLGLRGKEFEQGFLPGKGKYRTVVLAKLFLYAFFPPWLIYDTAKLTIRHRDLALLLHPYCFSVTFFSYILAFLTAGFSFLLTPLRFSAGKR